jgi:hypothetical protein
MDNYLTERLKLASFPQNAGSSLLAQLLCYLFDERRIAKNEFVATAIKLLLQADADPNAPISFHITPSNPRESRYSSMPLIVCKHDDLTWTSWTCVLAYLLSSLSDRNKLLRKFRRLDDNELIYNTIERLILAGADVNAIRQHRGQCHTALTILRVFFRQVSNFPRESFHLSVDQRKHQARARAASEKIMVLMQQNNAKSCLCEEPAQMMSKVKGGYCQCENITVDMGTESNSEDKSPNKIQNPKNIQQSPVSKKAQLKVSRIWRKIVDLT